MGSTSGKDWYLHGFCDASTRAYVACLYFVPFSGTPFLICAKSKVAPVKTLSVTKLELLGAYILAKLIEWTLNCFPVQPSNIHCWCVSRNVLCLLKITPCKLKTFEANKVSSILTILPNVEWRHVPGKDNPADCATRGFLSNELRNSNLWWHGPEWLNNESLWPENLSQSTDSNELTSIKCHFIDTIHNDKNEPWFYQFSKFQKLIRVAAFCRR